MIITKVIGGLGNQMYQYAIGRAISIKNNSHLKVDISDFSDYKLHNGYRLDAFNIDVKIATKSEVINMKGSDSLISRLLRRFFPLYKPQYYKEKGHTCYDTSVYMYDSIYLDGYWQNSRYFDDIRETLINDFSLKSALSENADQIMSIINSSESVGLHVRRGDFLKHSDVGVLDIAYYQRAVSYISNNVTNMGDIKFFVFSNDIAWCKNNLSFITNCTFVDNTESELEDLLLMSNCKHNIIANSSYSWWAGWLNDNQAKIVIYPAQWMKVNPNNYTWGLDDWIKL